MRPPRVDVAKTITKSLSTKGLLRFARRWTLLPGFELESRTSRQGSRTSGAPLAFFGDEDPALPSWNGRCVLLLPSGVALRGANHPSAAFSGRRSRLDCARSARCKAIPIKVGSFVCCIVHMVRPQAQEIEQTANSPADRAREPVHAGLPAALDRPAEGLAEETLV